MASVGTVISYPIPAYQNVPIEPQFYQPSRFVISAITLGQTTTITTTAATNYVIGQLVRLLVPIPYGSYQLNNLQGYVISLPSSTQVELDIDSSQFNAYVSSPFVATISNISQTIPAVLTVNHPIYGASALVEGVSGMTEINGQYAPILFQTSTTITLLIDSRLYSAYGSGGTVTAQPFDSVAQILAIGDINYGQINSNGSMMHTTSVLGSYINIS